MDSDHRFAKLGEPGRIGAMTIRNRMVMAPMATVLHSEEGYVTQRTKDYYEARARGGMGLIIVEATTIDSPEGKGFRHQLVIDDDRCVPGLRELAATIHQHDAKIAIQLHHIAARGISKVTKHQLVAPSAVAAPGGEMPRALTEEEIARLVTCYAQAARRAREAGLDGVEVHAAHGYLISEFLYPETNLRQDRYGGSTENRARFLVEILTAIRETVGAEYPVWCRIGADVVEEYCHIIEQAGVDAIHITVPLSGRDPSVPPSGETAGSLLPRAEAVKKLVSVPVIAVGLIEPEIGEAALSEGKVDFISFGRAVLADPEFCNKVTSGRLDDIKPCIRCNNCLYSILTAHDGVYGVRCSVNPTLGGERELRIIKAPKTKKVMIIGGGPAGMEAARVAALRGHQVHLYEKGSKPGGQLLLAELPRYKKTIGDLISYLSRQLEKLGVEVHLSTEATVDLVAEETPDAVVLAAGAHPFIPDITGIGSANVVLAADVLTGGAKTGDRVVIIGGELVGCEVADLLAAAGKKVTVTTLESDLLSFGVVVDTRRSLLYRLSSLGVTVITDVLYKEITEDSVILTDGDGKEHSIEADSVVIAAGNKPNTELLSILREKVAEVYPVGDCVEPRKILEAMDEGYRAGLLL